MFVEFGVRSCVPKLEVLATLEGELGLGLAVGALESKDDLLGGLSLLVEDWLGLTSVTRLLSVVTTLSLCEKGSLNSVSRSSVRNSSIACVYLSGLVLGDLVLGVLAALLALAVGASGLWNVDLRDRMLASCSRVSSLC